MSRGFRFFLVNDPGIFENLVKEFAYSFKPAWPVISRKTSNSGIDEKHVVQLSFRLGKEIYLYENDIRQAFKLDDCSLYPLVLKDTRPFWRMITRKDVDFKFRVSNKD